MMINFYGKEGWTHETSAASNAGPKLGPPKKKVVEISPEEKLALKKLADKKNQDLADETLESFTIVKEDEDETYESFIDGILNN